MPPWPPTHVSGGSREGSGGSGGGGGGGGDDGGADMQSMLGKRWTVQQAAKCNAARTVKSSLGVAARGDLAIDTGYRYRYRYRYR
jgi:hypothetical protein